MNLRAQGHHRLPFPALCVLAAFAISGGPPIHAQNAEKTKAVVAIDGALDPQRVPDWILWRELFAGVRMLADQAPDAGRQFWTQRLDLSPQQVSHLITLARALNEDEKKLDATALKLTQGSKTRPSGTIKSQLHQMESDKQSRVLSVRDTLRSRIGPEALLRLQSYISINIAPHIKVGALVSDGK